MNLYEINQQITEAFDAAVDPETGEVVNEEALDKLRDLQMSRDDKVENIGLWIKDLKADADALKSERDGFNDRLKAVNNKIESLQKYLQNSLAGEKFKTARLSISYRNTPSVNVTDFDSLPFEFKRFKDPEADKAKIKQAIKAGQTVPGAELVTNTSMIIK